MNGAGLRHVEARALHGARFRYFDFVMVAFVVVLLLSNVIGAEKRSFVTLPGIGPWPFGAGILFFPISYVIDDVLTEVYGFARARRAIWAGFAALLFMALMEWTVVHLPVAEGWTGQPAYERVFGSGWRIILASMTAFFVGDFLNSVVLAKMKIWTAGKHLWTRTIGSTVVGEGADSLIFYPLAFYGMPDWPVAALGAVMLSQFVLKVSWEALLTPVTYAVVGWLKKRKASMSTTSAPISRPSPSTIKRSRFPANPRTTAGRRCRRAPARSTRSGCGMRPSTLPASLRMPAMFARRAVDFIEIAQCDPAFAFQPVERRFVGLVIPVVVGDRQDDLLAGIILRGEQALAVLDAQRHRRGRRSSAAHCASVRRAAARPRSAPGSRCRCRSPARRARRRP